jgi:hypothetical protein
LLPRFDWTIRRGMKLLLSTAGLALSLGALAIASACSSATSPAPTAQTSDDAGTDTAVPPPKPTANAEEPMDAGPPADANDAATEPLPKETITTVTTSAVLEAATEPTIAVSPDGTWIVTFIAYRKNVQYATIGYAFSKDQGKTFSAPQFLEPTSFSTQSLGNAAVAYDKAGNAHIILMAFDIGAGGQISKRRVGLASAKAGESNFSKFDVIPNFDDAFRPTIASNDDGSVWLGATVGLTNPYRYVVANTQAFSGSFTSVSVPVPTSTTFLTEARARLCSAGKSMYLVGYAITEPSPRRIATTVRRAPTGTTFDNDVTVIPADDTTLTDTVVTCAASGSEVWIAYGLGKLPGNSDVETPFTTKAMLAHSSDQGKTFATAKNFQSSAIGHIPIVGMDGNGAPKVFFHGSSALEAQGSVFARELEGDAFSDPRDLGPIKIRAKRIQNPRTFSGDYFGTAAIPNGIAVSYIDNAGTSAQVKVAALRK